jgi:hypothetical protein
VSTDPMPADTGADAPEYDASVKEYHFSRARYIRAVTSDTEKKLMESVAKRRDPLQEEITNLNALARMRFDARQVALKAYAASTRSTKLPSKPLKSSTKSTKSLKRNGKNSRSSMRKCASCSNSTSAT